MIDIDIQKSLMSGSGHMDLKVKLAIPAGTITALYGPSGSGKSSIVRMICGLMRPDHGTISVNNEAWFDQLNKTNKPPQRRNIGVVFQEPALFPHMTVRQNIEFAKQDLTLSNDVSEILEFMELTNLSDKKPQLLSGGQKQRVALARAIVRRPTLLLLDEPTSAMDTSLQLKMQDYIIKIQQELKMTIILVSHDILEIVRLASLCVIVDNGKVADAGVPKEILPVQELKDALNAIK
ncbi:MAG: ATP-binding cassette domain-containing protein [Chryseolinea sp.]